LVLRGTDIVSGTGPGGEIGREQVSKLQGFRVSRLKAAKPGFYIETLKL
jgi:hypothetical protein